MVPTDADEPTLAADDLLDGVGRSDDDPREDVTLGGEAVAGPPSRPTELPEVDRERYTVGEHVASGGGGRIHVAYDTWLGRTVALKRLRPRPDRTARDRFTREARLTARLQHPGIVPVYEAGRWPGGHPFYAMKLVSGQPLSQQVAATRTLAERLALLPHVLAVAEAIAYAHSHGVIHRDLKPANVLVGKFGETVVIDWGLGKDLGDDTPSGAATDAMEGSEDEPVPDEPRQGDEDGELTRAGAVMGTPAYMPPEQARGEAVGPAADVYALGAMLYAVLAGRPPYGRGTGVEVLSRVLLGPPPPLVELVPQVPHELAAIVTKAMAREPHERYPTAASLAEDLRRHQTGQIVGAHRYTTRQRLRRWLWRHRTAVTASTAALLVLVVGGAYSHLELRAEHDQTVRAYRRAEEARTTAVTALGEAEAARDEAEAARAEAAARSDALLIERAKIEVLRNPNAALGCLSQLSPSFTRWPRAQVIAADAAARGLASVLHPCPSESHERTAVGACVQGGARALMVAGPGRIDVLRGDGRIEGFLPLERRSLGVVVPAEGVVHAARRGDTVVTFDDAGELRRWDVPSQTSDPLGQLEGPLTWVRLVGEHGVLALETGPKLSTLWHWAPDQPLRSLSSCARNSDQHAPPVAASPSGRWAGCVGADSQLVLIDLEGHGRVSTYLDGLPRDVVVNDDGRFVAWASSGATPTIWDVAADRRLHPTISDESPFQGLSLTFLPGAPRLLASAYEGTVALWEPGRATLQRLSSHEAMVYAHAFSDDGRWAATTAGNGTLHLHDVAARTVRRLEGFSGAGLEVELLPNDEAVVVMALDQRVHAWPIASAHGEILVRLGHPAFSIAVDPTGTRVLVGGAEGSAWLLPLEGPLGEVGEPRRLEGLRGNVSELAFSPDGTTMVAASAEGVVGLWTAEGEPRWIEELDGASIRGLSFSANGAQLAVAAYDRGVLRLATAMGQRGMAMEGARVAGVTLLAADDMLVWSHDGWVGLWSSDGRERLRKQLTDEVWVARVSPSGDALVVAGRDGALRRYALPSGDEQVAAAGRIAVTEIVYVDGGQRLVTMGNDQRVRLWDAHTLELERTLSGHGGHLSDLSVRDGGARIVTTSHDGTARLWDMASGEPRALVGHTGSVSAAVLLPDGRVVLTAGVDGTVRRWPDDVPDDQAGLRRWLDEQLAKRQ